MAERDHLHNGRPGIAGEAIGSDVWAMDGWREVPLAGTSARLKRTPCAQPQRRKAP
jgi:hypothetical protein